MVHASPQLPTGNVTTSPSPVLHMLRAATATRHKSLEARLPLTHPDLDQHTYARIIAAYYGFHVPLQRRIDAFLGPHGVDPERQKIPALRKDLQALGLNQAQIDALALCDELPGLDAQAHLLGIMYVMEGATLGGQVLRRIIAQRLSIDADTGGEFLDVYGRDTGRLWKAFLKQLADFDHPEHNAQVIDAACMTFACFEAWLDRAGVLKPGQMAASL